VSIMVALVAPAAYRSRTLRHGGGYRPDAWRYRDWIIDAFNRDLPFDRFTIEQLAGDLLPGASLEDRTAAGFHRMTMFNRPAAGKDNEEEFRVKTAKDRASTTATVWLGLTFGCAECHTLQPSQSVPARWVSAPCERAGAAPNRECATPSASRSLGSLIRSSRRSSLASTRTTELFTMPIRGQPQNCSGTNRCHRTSAHPRRRPGSPSRERC
jgi:hypothetical protein